MYIDPFICGVAATIIVEMIGVVAFAIYQNKKNQVGGRQMNTYNKVIEYLESYQKLKYDIIKYEHLKEGIKAISYSQEEKGTVMVKDMLLGYIEKIEELKAKQLEVVQFVEKNFKDIEGVIISDRYINGMTLKEIGKNIGYTNSHVRKMIDKAIYRYLSKQLYLFLFIQTD